MPLIRATVYYQRLLQDHFGLILNEPAGKIAQIVVVYSTELIVKTWFDDSNPIDQILEAFHHPYFADRRSSIQHRMFEEMERWIGGLGPDEASQTIQALTKESFREGKNKRLGDGGEGQVESGYGGSTSFSLGPGNYGGNRTEQYVNGQGGQYESRGSEYQDQSYGRREAGYVEEDYRRENTRDDYGSGESQEYKENRETGYEGDQYHY